MMSTPPHASVSNTQHMYIGTQTMRLIQIHGSPQAQVGPPFHSLSTEVVNAFPGNNVMPGCCVEVKNSMEIWPLFGR